MYIKILNNKSGLKHIAVIMALFISASAFCAKNANKKLLNITLLNFMANKSVSIYQTPAMDSIIAKIKNNASQENYYAFEVLEKKDSMLYVIAWCTKKKKELKGWIKITDAGIYLRPRKSVYHIYKSPDYKSDNIKIVLHGSYLVKVLDIKNTWLKVEIRYNHKWYRYWLPYEYQCSEIYNSCT